MEMPWERFSSVFIRLGLQLFVSIGAIVDITGRKKNTCLLSYKRNGRGLWHICSPRSVEICNAAVFKSNCTCRKILHIHLVGVKLAAIGNTAGTGAAGNQITGLKRMVSGAVRSHRRDLGVSHKPQHGIQHMYANVDQRAAAAKLFHMEAPPCGDAAATNARELRIINLAKFSLFHIRFCSQSISSIAHTLARHQQFSLLFSKRIHFCRVCICECQGFLTQHMTTSIQRQHNIFLVECIGDTDGHQIWLYFIKHFFRISIP